MDIELVLHAAGACLGTALKDIGEYGGSTYDRDLDAWGADLYACWAEVGEPPWRPRGATSRRAFWTWYLDDAVPVAADASRPEHRFDTAARRERDGILR